MPHWVKTDAVTIPSHKLDQAADLLHRQLGPDGIERIGGKTWWQWRRDNADLKAEWVEMRKDYQERVAAGDDAPQRIMLYIHGGAYYFGSVDEHRYQLQRHARKLKARILAPRYRLAPQFPFPCGLHDSIATYLYLLEEGHDPATILVAGDSAGGGMVLSMLVTLRDQGIALPAGGILLSPWVDLTHSFPSVGGNDQQDYIPSFGFMHKPSVSWPPPNADDMAAIEKGSMDLTAKLGKGKSGKGVSEEAKKERARGYSIEQPGTEQPSVNQPPPEFANTAFHRYVAAPPPNLSITIDGKLITIKDQIQLYAANHLLTHPLVSPALQPTLGGLPPLLVQVGGGELLRDEQIYLAHKAAHPSDYLPDLSHCSPEQVEHVMAEIRRYGPTDVKLEVWDDMCHVGPTLSFTRPAKFMYRSIAQFGAWALARAQQIAIDIEDTESISNSSSSGDDAGRSRSAAKPSNNTDGVDGATPMSGVTNGEEVVGRAGDPIPEFHDHMVRQRINRHGKIRAMEPVSQLEALQMPSEQIGVIKEIPVRKWMASQQKWATKFAKEKRNLQKKRIEELAAGGYEEFEGETPPPTALAGRRLKDMPKLKKVKKSWGMSMWSGWGSKHDQTRVQLERRAEAGSSRGTDRAVTSDGRAPRRSQSVSAAAGGRGRRNTAASRRRSHSMRRTVTDEGQSQTTTGMSEDSPDTGSDFAPGHVTASAIGPAAAAAAAGSGNTDPVAAQQAANENRHGPAIVIDSAHAAEGAPPTIVPASDTGSTRPTREGIAYPFKLSMGHHRPNPSTTTLMSFASQRTEGSGSGTDTESVRAKHESAGTWARSCAASVGDVADKKGSEEDLRAEKVLTEASSEAEKRAEEEAGLPERPAPERFVTADEF